MALAEKPAGTQVAVAGKTQLAPTGDTDLTLALGEEFLDGNDSLDDFGQGDFLVPYLRILQQLSKELQKGHQKYIKGSEAGQVINSATKHLWDGEEGMYVIPIAFSHRYQAWRPNNGGPADDYGADDTVYKSLIPDARGKRVNAEGNEVVDACQYFVYVVNPTTGDYDMGVISMSGSQAKKSRQWNSVIANRKIRVGQRSVVPPMFFYAYKLRTVPESNEQGNWYGWSINAEEGMPVAELPNARDILADAKSTRERIKAGEIKTQAEEVELDMTAGEENAF